MVCCGLRLFIEPLRIVGVAGDAVGGEFVFFKNVVDGFFAVGPIWIAGAVLIDHFEVLARGGNVFFVAYDWVFDTPILVTLDLLWLKEVDENKGDWAVGTGFAKFFGGFGGSFVGCASFSAIGVFRGSFLVFGGV